MADKIPGTIPAASISATETCARIAYRTKNVDGGIIEPSVPATATNAVAIDAGYPAARISETESRADRKSTRLNSSHVAISYAVFCLKKKNTNQTTIPT